MYTCLVIILTSQANGKVTIPGSGNEKVSWVLVEDFAAVLPEVLQNPKSKNASVRLIAQELSFNEVVAIIEKTHGRLGLGYL